MSNEKKAKPDLGKARELIASFDTLYTEVSGNQKISDSVREELRTKVRLLEELMKQIDYWQMRGPELFSEYAITRVRVRKLLMRTLSSIFSTKVGFSTEMTFANTDLIVGSGDKFYLRGIPANLKTELSKGHIYEFYSMNEKQIFLTDLSSTAQEIAFMSLDVFDQLEIQPLQ